MKTDQRGEPAVGEMGFTAGVGSIPYLDLWGRAGRVAGTSVGSRSWVGAAGTSGAGSSTGWC